jgi:hypothetical protein
LSNSTVSGILPAPTIAYIPRSFTEYIISERASLLERQHLSKMTPLMLQNAGIKAIVENLERLFG